MFGCEPSDRRRVFLRLVLKSRAVIRGLKVGEVGAMSAGCARALQQENKVSKLCQTASRYSQWHSATSDKIHERAKRLKGNHVENVGI